MAKLRVSRAARADMRGLFRQSVEMFGLRQADAYVASLQDTLDLIATYPKSNRERDDTAPPVRVHPHRAHVIVYALNDQGVLVLRI
ncbi:type II toxin-antitoxin system RelE/ParE family toxin [Brevundimonas sp. SH203]|uniref:type II toxin-antitoxin system RelE/ParE family toxin n=1 Tax=Brevundimonas sp. SH203 TaxID=345167 RepID=UPI000B3587D9|nr:type II toxin-antitoxin system RelE/ParE family toxin [Brevundimonas sp. SH203]